MRKRLTTHKERIELIERKLTPKLLHKLIKVLINKNIITKEDLET